MITPDLSKHSLESAMKILDFHDKNHRDRYPFPPAYCPLCRDKIINVPMETPDLSKEFYPIPKPARKVKMPVSVNKVGTKTKTWTDIRNELKEKFYKAGIRSCEYKGRNCWKDNSLTFAHLDKRRRLTNEDLYTVCLLCTPCHMTVEAKPVEEMAKILQGVIDKRKVKV